MRARLRPCRPRSLRSPAAPAIVALGALAAGLLTACLPTVATFVVTVGTDGVDVAIGDGACATAGGACSLRAAVQEANAVAAAGMVEIMLPAATTMTLGIPGAGEDAAATGDLDVHRPVRLVGAAGATIDAGGIDRVLDVHAGGELEVVDTRVQGGSVTADGGGIRAGGTALTLTRTAVAGNTAVSSSGGGIRVIAGTITLDHAVIEDNVAGLLGGGLVAPALTARQSSIVDNTGLTGAAVTLIDTGAPSSFDRVTVAGNVATSGSAMHTSGPTDIVDSTITRNATQSAALFRSSGSVSLRNSIVADQTAGLDCSTPLTSLGHNLEAGTSCGFAATGDRQGATANLQDRSIVAGLPVHAPGRGFAMDAGDGCGPLDQVDQPRPVDGDGNGTATCDRGAVEAGPTTLPVVTPTTTIDGVDAAPGDGVCAVAGSGLCSLRAAVQETNAQFGADTIELPANDDYDLSITGTGENAGATGDLDITDRLTLIGSAAAGSRNDISGGQIDRVLDVRPSAGEVVLRRVNVQSGFIETEDGGGIRVTDSRLVGDKLSVVSNRTRYGRGAGIFSTGPIELDGSYLSSNRITDEFFGSAGAILATDTLTLRRTTVATNFAPEDGGGVVHDPQTEPGTGPVLFEVDVSTFTTNGARSAAAIRTGARTELRITDSTIAGNSNTFAGSGVLHSSASVSPTVRNSIVGGNFNGDCQIIATAVTSGGTNLESGTSCGFTGFFDLQNTAPGLGAPVASGQPGGGALSLLPTSPALDTGANCDATDQRGVARPFDGDGNGTTICDRGAYEVDSVPPVTYVVNQTSDAPDNLVGDGLCRTAAVTCTLRAAVQEANARPSDDTIELASGSVHQLSVAGVSEDGATTGDLDVVGNLTIRATGASIATIDGNDIDRILDVQAGGVLTLHRVLVTDGTAPAGQHGGGVRGAAGASVHLIESQVAANLAERGAGLLLAGPSSMLRSTVSGNTASQAGGGVQSTTSFSATDSTVSGNSAPIGGNLEVTAGSLTVVGSTITKGSSTIGAGIRIGTGVTATVRASIVAAQTSGADCNGAIVSLGHNLSSLSTCSFTATGDAQGTNPNLGALLANGGVTPTHLPAAGSPAIGTGTCATTTDQRGVARPQGGACDKGSVEQ